MLRFIQSIYKNTEKSIRWRIIVYNFVSSILSVGWLVQLHYLIKNFDLNTSETIFSIIGTIITFLISILFFYLQTKKDIQYVSKSMLVSALELWNQFINLNYEVFKHQQRIVYFDVFMVNYWRIRNGYHALIVNLIPTLFTSLLLLVFLLYIHPLIAIIFIVFYFILLFLQLGIHRKMGKSTNEFHDIWRIQANNIGRWIDQYELGKLGRGKENSRLEFEKGFDFFLQKGDDVTLKKAKWSGVQSIIIQISRVGTLLLAYFLYKAQIIDIASIFSAIVVLGWLQTQLTKIQSSIPLLMEAANSFEFNQDFLKWNSSKDFEKKQCDTDLIPIQEIELQNVNFMYNYDKKVINNINFKLEFGKVYLIKGDNGSGKTTLAKIILGLLTGYSGSLKINQKNIENKFSDDLKYRMSYLHQDTSLFYGTVQENYTFGLKNSPSDLYEMGKILLNDIFHENIHIGEKGEKLSGGQKQRLSLIREWGKDSDLYILDEPLNHLDKDSTEWLKSSVLQKKNSSIIIIISHQAGFEEIADEIKYLKNGKLHDTTNTNS